MGKTELAGEASAILCQPLFGGHDNGRLDGCQPGIGSPDRIDERQEALLVRSSSRHAACRLRKETMIDFDVGVSLWSPALSSGTSTFSSG